MFSSNRLRGASFSVLYLLAILITALAVVIGVFLNWVSALWGPGIGVFGVDAWSATFAAVPAAIAAIWTWRISGRRVSAGIRKIGRVLAVAAFVGSVVGANYLLALSWISVCDDQRPEICYHLGDLLASMGRTEMSDDAYRNACEGGHRQGCSRIGNCPDHAGEPDDCRGEEPIE